MTSVLPRLAALTRRPLLPFAASLFATAALLTPLRGEVAAQPSAASETAAKEQAAKKATEDKATIAAFKQWKATLPPAQQAWETILEENLGTFYLPLYQKDKVAGRTTAWDYVVDDPKLPRVLLIGDSISRAYTLGVRTELAGKVNVHRAPENCGPTSNGVKKLDLWLGDGKWDLIYFNFGIHDRAVPLADYEARLNQIIARLERTGAKLVWASSTPLPAQSTYGSNQAMIDRNAVAARVAAQHHIPVDDLYTFITPHLAETQKANDVHYSDKGYQLFSHHVATTVSEQLNIK